MKNIHILPTDKPSRLGKFIDTNNLFLRTSNDIPRGENVYIYITSDEEIKEGDWYFITESISKCESKYEANDLTDICKKIILTTDQSLDGVQAIDDEFLQWFVNNPSCEEVEIKKQELNIDYTSNWKQKFYYKIIIPKEEPKQELPQLGTKEFNDLAMQYFGGKPKQETLEEEIECSNCGNLMSLLHDNSVYACFNHECTSCYEEEPKQETLEEAAEKYVKHFAPSVKSAREIGFIDGAKYQADRTYSDMQEYAEFCIECDRRQMPLLLVQDWYEHDKK